MLVVALLTGATASADPGSLVVLQGLDKVTARVTTLRARVGQTVKFGTLEIMVRRCERAPADESPERAAFLQIREVKKGEAAVALFSGWMFASSPALHALEHPVYDVWVTDCRIDSTSSAASSP